ncbi:hypothetical protein C8R42DRAFT_598124, partial [Lentinula raphanica]
HIQIAWDMLQKAIIGPGEVNNSLKHYFKGFTLPCGPLNLLDIVKSFYGGPEEFVATALASKIEDLHDLYLEIKCQTSDLEGLANALVKAGPQFSGKIFKDIIQDFLTGVGAPCPQMLEAIKETFSIAAKDSLLGIQSSTFRMQTACWAITGASRIIQEGEPISIMLVDDDEAGYTPPDAPEDVRKAYLLTGASSYDTDTEPKDAQAALHHWLLVQMLESIGSYSIV